MSTDESEIIARLKFLQNVRPGDKIDTGLVVRQPNDWLTPFSRYIRGETKAKTLAFLRKTLDDAFELYMQYFNSEKDHLVELSKVVITDLQTSLVGIANLKKTYSYDLKFMCDLTTISERTQMRLQSVPLSDSSKSDLNKMGSSSKHVQRNDKHKQQGKHGDSRRSS
tara:strand:+ start:256 stop:756 length:501 start_codon:yes stop_codon:yes gene_type:complete